MSAMVEVLTPWELTNGTNQGFFLLHTDGLPAHHSLLVPTV